MSSKCVSSPHSPPDPTNAFIPCEATVEAAPLGKLNTDWRGGSDARAGSPAKVLRTTAQVCLANQGKQDLPTHDP